MSKGKLLNNDDQYEVQVASIITDFDNKILLRLYQPICGYAPIAIYLTLTSELEAERTITTTFKSHHRLFAILSINADKFLKYRRYLEALGLLKTYYLENEKERKYIYQLLSPRLPDNFFSHPILGSLLKSRLSEEEYERTKVYFAGRTRIRNNYEEISAKFPEVFKMNETSYVDDGKIQLKSRNEAEINMIFDYEAFFIGLKDYQIPKNIIGDNDLKKISEYANLYNISAFEMRNIVAQSIEEIDNIKRINLERLSIFSKRYYESLSINPTRNKPINKSTPKVESNSAATKKLNLFTSMSPQQYLKYRNNNIEPLSVDLLLINELRNETRLEDEVINVILDYCLFKNDNRLTPNYVKKVAASIVRSNIHDAYQAMVYLSNSNKTQTRQYVDINDDHQIKEKIKNKSENNDGDSDVSLNEVVW